MTGTVDMTILTAAVTGSWSAETSFSPETWSEENPALGQCAVTALVVQDFFGGEILRISLLNHKDPQVSAMSSHYYNRIGDREIDLTGRQFSGDANEFDRVKQSQEPQVRTRSYLLENQNTRNRYYQLRFNVARTLSNYHFLFNDDIYRECLMLALQSDCQKAKFGCVVRRGDGKIIARTFNHVLKPNSDWCSSECIRMKIQSRIESMIGCCGHAEEFALVDVRDARISLGGCDLFIAGFYPNGLAHIKREAAYTCLRCATQMYLHRIGRIFVPTILNGWWCISAEEAMNTAKAFALKEKSI